jgi:uncharacterized protein involved in response to NO
MLESNGIEERIRSVMKTKNITVLSVLMAFIIVAGTIIIFFTASAVADDTLINNNTVAKNLIIPSMSKDRHMDMDLTLMDQHKNQT